MEAAEKKHRRTTPLTLVENTEEVSGGQEREIDLIELLYFLLGKLKYIILAAVLGAMFALLYTLFMITPQYEAKSELYVTNSADSVLNLSDLQIGSYLASDYIQVFDTWEVKQKVIDNLSLGSEYTYRTLGGMVKVVNPSNTRILRITVSSPDPDMAMKIANEYAAVVSDYVSEIMSTEKPNILSSALKPVAPVSPSKTRNTLIGFLLGAVLVGGVLVVQFVMDDKIKSTDDILRYAGLPTLAVIPLAGQGSKSHYGKYAAYQKSEGSRKP